MTQSVRSPNQPQNRTLRTQTLIGTSAPPHPSILQCTEKPSLTLGGGETLLAQG